MLGGNRNPAWTDLPQELLNAIANSLTSNPLDIFVFRSVCKSWRSSFPRLTNSSLLSPHLPLSIPSPPFYIYGGKHTLGVTVIYAFYRPIEIELELPEFEFSTSCILFLDEFTPGKVTLRLPLSSHSSSLPITFPKTINLIDFNVRELGRFYNLSYSINLEPLSPQHRYCSEDKVVLFPNGLGAVLVTKDGRLGLIRLDSGINEWEIIHDAKGFRFDDIVGFKGRVLGIDRRARVYEIHYQDSCDINPVIPPIAGGGGWRKRLLESSGKLYLVVKCKTDTKSYEVITKETKFKVYELDEKNKKWFEISSLGDRSFFFGRDCSFSASARELGSCGKNCILFKNLSFQSYTGKDDMFPKLQSDDLDIGVCHLNNALHFDVIGSYPGYSDTLWPPPSWIWPIHRSKRLGILEAAADELLDMIPKNLKTNINQQIALETLKLKKMTNEVQEIYSDMLRKVKETIDKVDKDIIEFENTIGQEKRSRQGTGEETDDRVAAEQVSAYRVSQSRSMMDSLYALNSFVFRSEELFSKMEKSLKARLKRLGVLDIAIDKVLNMNDPKVARLKKMVNRLQESDMKWMDELNQIDTMIVGAMDLRDAYPNESQTLVDRLRVVRALISGETTDMRRRAFECEELFSAIERNAKGATGVLAQ